VARLHLRALRRALTSNTLKNQSVHFHNGPQGQPAACFDDGCRSPRLQVG
jgi:hypothetical protein